MSAITKTIEKEIEFFNFESINAQTIDDLIEFCSKKDGVIISRLIIHLINNKPNSIEIGINIGGAVMEVELKPNIFYYFRGNELNGVENVDDVNWW